MSESTEQTVRDLMAKIFAKELPASGNITRATTPEWDSLKHIELVFTLEDTFSMNFEAAKLNDLDSLQIIVEALERTATA